MKIDKTLLITGGAGFIGSNFIRHILEKYPSYKVINYDVLSYAGNLDNLRDFSEHPNYQFVHGDICDRASVNKVFRQKIDVVLNFAAETHVDRSIGDPGQFILTDMYGTHVLLEQCRKSDVERYIQISTDEIYGSIEEGSFYETSPISPNNPYSASKAGADCLCRSYKITYNYPIIITRSSNNYGPYQYPEKFIPLFTINALRNEPLPLYGDGLNVRDWLYVKDNCEGIDLILHKGELGEIYNIGGDQERQNIEVAKLIIKYTDRSPELIRPVSDRKGHDRRYSLNCDKIKELGWNPGTQFEQGLQETVKWYRDNEWWWKKIMQGDFKSYYKKQYKELIKEE